MLIGKQFWTFLGFAVKINSSVDLAAVLFRSLLIIKVSLPDVLVKKINMIEFV